MKKLFAVLFSLLLLFSLAACGKTDDSKSNANNDTNQTTEAQTDSKPAVADISGWNWVKGELNCYDYSYNGQTYYLSYSYPDNFKTSEEAYSGLQNFNYFFNPSDESATPNSSPYGLYIHFGQGTNGGATKSSLEESIQGGFVERELGGRKVLFGELPADPNTGSHTFAYYLSYAEDDWSRIWILLCDPEPDGEFRKAFEESMSFDK